MSVEYEIKLLLKSRNYLEINYTAIKGAVLAYDQGKDPSFTSNTVFSCDVEIGKTIYGEDYKVDFLLLNKEVFPNKLSIICIDWDKLEILEQSGVVKTQFPYFLMNINKNIIPTYIVLSENQYLAKDAITWLEDQISQGNSCLIGVFTMTDFIQAISKGLLNNKV